MLCLVGLCFVGYRKDLTIILLCMAMGFKGAMYSGYMCSHQDLTPNYAGTLFGLTNCLATVPGFLAPLVVGIITHDNVSIPVFFVSITLDSICILPVFFVCGCVRDNYSFLKSRHDIFSIEYNDINSVSVYHLSRFIL